MTDRGREEQPEGTRGETTVDTIEAVEEAVAAPATAVAPGEVRGALWMPFVAIAAVVIAADQLTKAWLVSVLEPGESLEVVGDLLRLVHSRNTGAVFGLFRDQAPLFALVSVGVIGLIAWFHGRSGRSPYMTLALGLLLGGAMGNLLDRVRLGHVVDFVDAGIGDLRFYTFNVADAAISCSLLLLIVVGVWPSLANPGTGRAGAHPTASPTTGAR